MKRIWGEGGYTIIEVMIVLAVSGSLLTSVMLAISGQQRRTEFQAGVRDFESSIQDSINDIETGYYPNTGNPGSATGSVYIGKAVQFYKNSSTNDFTLMRQATIRGDAKKVSGEDVVSIDDTNPTIYNTSQTKVLYSGIALTKIVHYGGATPRASMGFAVISGITNATNSNGTSGSKGKFAYIGPSSSNDSDENSIKNEIQAINNTSIVNSSKGIVFCLRESGGGRVAAVSYGIVPGPTGPIANGQSDYSISYFDDEAIKLGCTNA